MDYQELIRLSTKGDKQALRELFVLAESLSFYDFYSAVSSAILQELFVLAESLSAEKEYEPPSKVFQALAIAYQNSAFRNSELAQSAGSNVNRLNEEIQLIKRWIETNRSGSRALPREELSARIWPDERFSEHIQSYESALENLGLECYSPGGSSFRMIAVLMENYFGLTPSLDQFGSEISSRFHISSRKTILEPAVAMQLKVVLESLLKIGQAETFDDIAHLVEIQASTWHGTSFPYNYPGELVSYAERLSTNDRIAFIKSVAVFEHHFWGGGSPTTLRHLLPFDVDPERSFLLLVFGPERDCLLHWILRNTRSYWYYERGACYFEGYYQSKEDEKEAKKARRAAERAQIQKERQQRAIARAPVTAVKLYNAVRRGDTKAVQALLANGADPLGLAPDGLSLLSIAERRGNVAIITVLHNALAAMPDPPSTTENQN